ncbi:molybdopterin-dependent oxidoreductase [Sporomusa acidovorans]|uniref:Pyrogallol hydroxytransferase large subunit n=1 Tax=Sporomusa acidovorans (strain ATCC 49682 / DSM 3132 / Mol) TaxID=1123286 RepID=A0ABZ3IZJ4_SPOA4|nr:molybdopterin-dependent oxidoreductase [Sporomusa acidovorans]OZC14206.1 pyrogallol hydroxytransferase large subunit [Sporomusa acidovorans DSM 3132]SDE71150.1 trimethylamine-N-oxide reductase (cytochrome c) [Sporomusa acidovorans]
MSKKNDEIKTFYKGLGFCGFGIGSNTAEVDVKDGKVLRIRPMKFDKKYKQEELNPWKIEVRGKTFEPKMKTLLPPFSYIYKKRMFSKNRVLYPLKRVDWDPNGERNTQNRGESKYVRISWDEATDIIANEIKRIHKQYGPYAILSQGDGHGETKAIHGPHGCQKNLLELLGGSTTQARNADSWEGWYWGIKHFWGCEPIGQGLQKNMWWDVSNNTKMLLYWGCDPETTPWGWGGQNPSRLCRWFKEIGIKSVFISPDLNYTGAVWADKWIPVIPNTDAALQLAIAYIWIKEDSYDKEYVATHTVGFEPFRQYVMGEEDGEAKTPEWASKICGVPTYTIKALARKWAKDATTIGHCNGGSYIRSGYSSEPARLEGCLLAMQGLGKPGRGQLKFIEFGQYGLHEYYPCPKSKVIPNVGGAYNGATYDISGQFLPKTLIPKAILGDWTVENPMTWYGVTSSGFPADDQFVEYQYPIEEGGSELHMIWTDTPCWTTCWNGGNSMIKALRSPKIEFVLAQHPWLENDCLFADIILPVSSKFEQEDIACDNQSGAFNSLYYEGKCVETRGEAKSDYECVCEVAKKLGVYEEYTKGMTYEDLIKRGFEMSGCQTLMSYEEFREKEICVVPTDENWKDVVPGFGDFANDPEENPMTTPSGKLEFTSENLSEYFPDDEERPPHPKFIPFGKTHQESYLHPRSEKYPYLLVSNHPRWRVHANMDDVTWLREIPTCKMRGKDGYMYEPVWINPVDAKKQGIAHGDVVKLYNERGWVLGAAYITERIMPHVIYQDHGSRLDPIVTGESDRAGANNLICPTNTVSQHCSGEVTSGFLVGIEKADELELAKQYPEQFNRPYCPHSGQILTSRVIENK